MVSLDILDDVQRMNKRQLYYQVLNFGKIVSSALMLWKGLTVRTGSESPAVIHEKQNGRMKFLTKGDNSVVDDRGLYKQGHHWLEKNDVVRRARGFVRYVGIVKILMNDDPKFKCAVLFLLVHYGKSAFRSGSMGMMGQERAGVTAVVSSKQWVSTGELEDQVLLTVLCLRHGNLTTAAKGIVALLLAAPEEHPLHLGELGDHTADLPDTCFPHSPCIFQDREKGTQQETA
ncbi:signal peptidase complex catalytic subunit SEC11A-like [Eubalaena glacialis]|uniref:signal peptidase complex catalytic subunit SEC11A-like n=1 Tax=Eubalaena glacialis TaxID=27606 RepID=UPI002A5AA627|nr:signal peptidase complex catalytic subunit SEC11A-like [Eubalaena glacialis]